MDADADEQIYDLRAALAAARRRLALIALFTGLAAGLALVVSLAQSDRYEATAVLLFKDPGLDPQIRGRPALLGGEQILDRTTNVGLVSLDAVADRTAEELGDGRSAAEIGDAVTATEGAGPELVDVTAEAEQAELAAATANAYAEAFLALRREDDLRAIRAAREAVERDLESLPAGARDSAEARALREQAAELRSLELLQTGDSQLVEEADVPGSRSAPKPLRNALLAGFAGLIFGLAAALVVERLDPRPRSRRDYARAYGAPVLATVPNDPRLGEAPLGPADVEAFRTLAMRLRFRDREKPPRSVLLVSAAGGEGRTTVAANLGRAVAADGFDVTLLEADFRRPRLAARAAAEPRPGLAELLAADCSRAAATRRLDLGAGVDGSLEIIVAGGPPPTPTALLGDERIAELFEDLHAGSDLVLVDAPALGEVADAVPLLGLVDAVLVVADCGEAKRSEVEALQRQLTDLDAPLVGVVVNRA